MKTIIIFLTMLTYIPTPNYQPMENREMSINEDQMRDLIKRTIEDFDKGLLSRDAIELLMLTFSAESNLGTYLKGNEGDGIGQMKRSTFNWLKEKYSDRWPILKYCYHEQLEYNHRIAIIFTRLLYLTTPEPLPDHRDHLKMAKYWKQYYNTPNGKGTAQKALAKYYLYAMEGKNGYCCSE